MPRKEIFAKDFAHLQANVRPILQSHLHSLRLFYLRIIASEVSLWPTIANLARAPNLTHVQISEISKSARGSLQELGHCKKACVMSMVSKCPLCSWFAAKTLMRHMGTVHAPDPTFFIRCGVGDCPRTYRNYHSYKKHLYKKHREMLDGPWSPTDDDTALLPNTSEDVMPPLCPSETELSECTLPRFPTIKDRKKEAALFVLKSKHIHKVSQSSLNG